MLPQLYSMLLEPTQIAVNQKRTSITAQPPVLTINKLTVKSTASKNICLFVPSYFATANFGKSLFVRTLTKIIWKIVLLH